MRWSRPSFASRTSSSNLTATMVYRDNGTMTPLTSARPVTPCMRWRRPTNPSMDTSRVLVPHLSAKRVRIVEEFAAQTAQLLSSHSVVGGRIEWWVRGGPAAHDGDGPVVGATPRRRRDSSGSVTRLPPCLTERDARAARGGRQAAMEFAG